MNDAITRQLVEKGIPEDQHDSGVWGYLHTLVGEFAKERGFQRGGAEHDDMLSAAYVTVCETVVPKFDPAKVTDGNTLRVFQAYMKRHVWGECKWEAQRLRNGGTYNTRDNELYPPVVAEGLPYRRGDDGDTYVAVADPIGMEPLDILIEMEEAKEPLREVVDTIEDLPPLERVVMKMRYSFTGGVGLDAQEVADKLKLTREQVEALEASAVARLQTVHSDTQAAAEVSTSVQVDGSGQLNCHQNYKGRVTA